MALSVNNHIRFMRNIILPVNVNDVHCCNSGASLEVCPEPDWISIPERQTIGSPVSKSCSSLYQQRTKSLFFDIHIIVFFDKCQLICSNFFPSSCCVLYYIIYKNFFFSPSFFNYPILLTARNSNFENRICFYANRFASGFYEKQEREGFIYGRLQLRTGL